MDDITVDRRGAAHRIAAALREDIEALRLLPGAAISRPGLRDRFGLSSTPIRDALTLLAQEGLVAVRPQSRTVVTHIDLDAVVRSHVLRLSLDLEVGRMACADPAALAPALNALLAQQQEAMDRGDAPAFSRLDAEFHRLQYRHTGMEELWHLAQATAGHFNRVRRLNLRREGNAARLLSDHRAIADAIAASDIDAAARAIRAHLVRSKPQTERLRQAHPHLFAAHPAG